MSKVKKIYNEKLSPAFLSIFFLFALFNPVFKKYDYGAGFPLILIFGAVIFILSIIEFKKKREVSKSDSGFLLLFGLCIVLSFVFSQTRNYGFSELLAYFSMIPLYLIFAHKKNEWMWKFLDIVIVASVLAVVLAYFLYFIKAEPRFIGPFFNTLYHAHVWPNAFSLFLLMTWPLFLLLPSKKSQWKISILIGFIISGIFLTFSRGALIVLGGQFVLLTFFFLKKIQFRTFLYFLLTLIVALSLFWNANYIRSRNFEVIDVSERVTFDNEEGLTSKQERIDFWLGSIEMIKEKPFFGWGPFSFRQVYNPIQKTFLGNADHPHNIFLKIASENGLIALLAFLFFLIAILEAVIKNFTKISAVKKNAVIVMCVSVAGAFAHNLIDYNFNFFSNLLLLFILLIFIRSLVVSKATKFKKSFTGLILGLIVFIFCIYEGGLLFLSYTKDQSYLEYSFFPRNYYLNEADEALQEDDFTNSLIYLEKELDLNRWDSQAYYLRGVVYCDSDFKKYDLDVCMYNFNWALNLNPMNDFVYYRDYFRLLTNIGSEEDIDQFIRDTLPLVENYFIYVKNNVHFTAYTPNVEAVAELIDLMGPYLPEEEVDKVLKNKDEMLEAAEMLRKNKEF